MLTNRRHAVAALLVAAVTLVPRAGAAAPRLTPLAAAERDTTARAIIERFVDENMADSRFPSGLR